MRDDARLNNIRPIVRVFSKKKKSKQKCGLYTRLDAFRDRFASLVTSFRTDCERKCDLVSRGPTCATERFEELKASTSTPKLYTPFGEKKNVVLYEMIHIRRERELIRDILFRVYATRTKRQGEERSSLS